MLNALTQLSHRITRFAAEPRKKARLNRWLAYREMRARTIRLRSRPFILVIEPGTMCNLKCPFCPTGNGTLTLKRELMSPETFRAIVGHVPVDLLYKVDLFNWGEPFLNLHVFEFIEYFSSRGIETVIHANFSAKDYDAAWFEALARSGLSKLVVSIDGATQETYEKYRRKGRLDRVLQNMRGVDEAKRRLGLATPRLVYKMLLNSFNEGEATLAAEHAARAGAELELNENFEVPKELRDEWMAKGVRAKFGDTPPASSGPRRPVGRDIHTECRQLWDSLYVNANGDVFPCCLVADPQMVAGNVAETPLDQLWNNEKMMAMRRFTVDPKAPALDFPNLCNTCTHRFCTHSAIQAQP